MTDEVYEKMRGFPEIRWSEVARRAISERVETLERIEAIASKSKLTEKDALEIGARIKHGMARRLGLVK
ncbi:hypothetical protein HY095_02490 [Candidatus Micrarchaeota archaeon]|nr:hypothetical protein [Candidatus Micrarchaeota archaeon]